MNIQIDFVVPWLDSTDPVWQEQFMMYSRDNKGNKDSARFRNMDIFQYWFRAVEKYAPWVRKVFLITNGTFPEWINKEHPKLVLVKHSDYMPAECLPTFNASAIELHIHRIKGLSEHFVYFNDDFFLNAPVLPDYYFRKGLPCDWNHELIGFVPVYDPVEKFGIDLNMLSCLGIVNAHFNRWKTVCQSPRRWFGFHLGIRGIILNCILGRQKKFIGFPMRHYEQPFLKSVLEDVWQKEPDFLASSCTRFRDDKAATQYVFRYWQFASNRFFPIKNKSIKGKLFILRQKRLKDIEAVLKNPDVVSFCLNDGPSCSNEEYRILNKKLQELLSQKFPEKSLYEI